MLPCSAGMKKKKRRGKLSTKPQDFQVRIKVWEARQLAGGNIHPVCKVTVSNQTKMTRVKKSTNRPYWDEVGTIFLISDNLHLHTCTCLYLCTMEWIFFNM